MGSLRDYYEADYNYALACHRTPTFATGGKEFETVERLHLDFRSNAKFISYYIPEIEHPGELCRYIFGPSRVGPVRVGRRPGFHGPTGRGRQAQGSPGLH